MQAAVEAEAETHVNWLAATERTRPPPHIQYEKRLAEMLYERDYHKGKLLEDDISLISPRYSDVDVEMKAERLQNLSAKCACIPDERLDY